MRKCRHEADVVNWEDGRGQDAIDDCARQRNDHSISRTKLEFRGSRTSRTDDCATYVTPDFRVETSKTRRARVFPMLYVHTLSLLVLNLSRIW